LKKLTSIRFFFFVFFSEFVKFLHLFSYYISRPIFHRVGGVGFNIDKEDLSLAVVSTWRRGLAGKGKNRRKYIWQRC